MLWLLLALLVAITETEQNVISVTQDTKTIESSEVTIEHTELKEEASQPIIITNAIEPSMLAYKHWTGTYSPEIFTITINGTQVDSGQTYSLDSTQTSLVIQVDYSFMNGIRKGSKKNSYNINKECTEAKLTFSWLDPHKFIIDNATLLTEETI